MFDNSLVSLLNDGGVVEVAFSLLALLGQDVAMISMLSLQLAATRYLETLLGSGLCLHFRHFTISLKVLGYSFLSLILSAFSY